MQRSYTKNYIHIYVWRAISIVTGFLSMLIVVPHLSSNAELFGIYSFCIAFTLYITYADIGFLSAGQKYAAEAYAKNDRVAEMKMLGFTGAILLLMILPFSLVMIYFSFFPDLVINDLSVEGGNIAGNLFLIIGLVLPIQVILQRLVQSILIIRIKDFVSMRIDVVFNLLNIASVLYFFRDGRYLVVQYYLFATLSTLIGSLIILFLIRKQENYDFFALIKEIRLSKTEYNITKKLAYGSLMLTVGWVIYYELDLIIIGKWMGSANVAIYAIGFTFLNFIRTLWNAVFSPFSQRFNHLVGTGSWDGMASLMKSLINYTFPLVVITTLVLALISEQLVYFWVGAVYSPSIVILQVLIIGTLFGFVSRPASYYFSANTKYRFIYLQAIITPLVFVIGLLGFVPIFGLPGVAIAKSSAMLVSFFISIMGIKEVYNPILTLRKWGIQLLTLCAALCFLVPRIIDRFFSSTESSTVNLVSLIGTAIVIILVSCLLLCATTEELRNAMKVGYQKMLALIRR